MRFVYDLCLRGQLNSLKILQNENFGELVFDLFNLFFIDKFRILENDIEKTTKKQKN